MGGLVILKGLVNRIRNEHGSTHPVNAVRWITLYSSPLLGSAVANVVSVSQKTSLSDGILLRPATNRHLS